MQRLNVILILMIVPFIWCKSQEDIEGFYSGKLHIPEFNQDILVSFDNGISVFSNHSPDSLNYKIKGNKIHFSPINYWGDDYKFKLRMIRDSLFMYRPKLDTLVYSLGKIQGDNYVDRLTEGADFNINLPFEQGQRERIYEIAYPDDYFFFVGKSQDSILVKYKGINYRLDSTLFMHIRNEFMYYDDFMFFRNPSMVFMDKDVQYSYTRLLLWNLRRSGNKRIWYVLKQSAPDSLNYITKRNIVFSESEYQKILNSIDTINIPPPPPPPVYVDADLEKLKSQSMIEVYRDSLIINNSLHNSKSISSIRDKINSTERWAVTLYVDDGATFGEYIYARSIFDKILSDLRNSYSQELYYKDYQDLFEEQKDEVEKKYPYSLMELDKGQYQKIKYGLQQKI